MCLDTPGCPRPTGSPRWRQNNKWHRHTATSHYWKHKHIMMTSSNANIFRVTGPLCGEFTSHRWIPLTKQQWRGALMFSLICAWINVWVNNHEAGDLKRHGAHYDVIAMIWWCCDTYVPTYWTWPSSWLNPDTHTYREQTVEQTMDTPVVWVAIALIMTSL